MIFVIKGPRHFEIQNYKCKINVKAFFLFLHIRQNVYEIFLKEIGFGSENIN